MKIALVVERFVEQGARVVFSGRRAELGAEVAAATGATFIEADVAREEDAVRTINAALGPYGRLDILVNNAGMGSPYTRIERLPLEVFDGMIAVHLRGAIAHMKHAAATMRPSRASRWSAIFTMRGLGYAVCEACRKACAISCSSRSGLSAHTVANAAAVERLIQA